MARYRILRLIRRENLPPSLRCAAEAPRPGEIRRRKGGRQYESRKQVCWEGKYPRSCGLLGLAGGPDAGRTVASKSFDFDEGARYRFLR